MEVAVGSSLVSVTDIQTPPAAVLLYPSCSVTDIRTAVMSAFTGDSMTSSSVPAAIDGQLVASLPYNPVGGRAPNDKGDAAATSVSKVGTEGDALPALPLNVSSSPSSTSSSSHITEVRDTELSWTQRAEIFPFDARHKTAKAHRPGGSERQ